MIFFIVVSICHKNNHFLHYFRYVIIIDTHKVPFLTTKIRFVDYCIGIFPQLMTKNAVKKAIKRKDLLINNVTATTGHWMCKGDEIKYIDNGKRIPKPFPLVVPIIYEDEYLVVVNKPSGISVSGNLHRTLENALVGKIQISTQEDATKWAKPVHRLDHATSGLVLFSKTAEAHRKLAKQFENRVIKKEYHAVVMGQFKKDEGIIESPIQHQSAITKYNQIKTVPSLRSKALSLVQLFPETGRTHQLRIHCSENDCPIVGDTIYGKKNNTLLHKGLFLASTGLSFMHPITGKEIKIKIDFPYKFKSLLEREARRWEKFNP